MLYELYGMQKENFFFSFNTKNGTLGVFQKAGYVSWVSNPGMFKGK